MRAHPRVAGASIYVRYAVDGWSMVIADEMVARQMIIAASKRPQRFLALRSFVLDAGIALLHNDGLANTCIAFFKPQVKSPS